MDGITRWTLLPLALLACSGDPGAVLGDPDAEVVVDDRAAASDGGLVDDRAAASDRAAPTDLPRAAMDAGADAPPTVFDVVAAQDLVTRDDPPPPPDLAAPTDAVAPFDSCVNPPASRPPAGAPDRSAVVRAVAGDHPDWLRNSCSSMGGTTQFLSEVLRRLRVEDRRWGLNALSGGITGDRLAYHWGCGHAEGSAEAYVLDVISSHCGTPGAGWIEQTTERAQWTLQGYSDMGPVDAGVVDSGPRDAGGGHTPPPLPNESRLVQELAAERADLLRGSCRDTGGNNDFLFELVRRLRRRDTRWGLNWKRGVVGDMSQDVVDYYFGPGAPREGATEVYIVDVIVGHCGPSPGPGFADVTEATRLGGTIGRWTLAGRSDL